MMSITLTAAQQVARQAVTEQISRLVHGVYVYASMLVVLAWTTPFAVDHPRVYWGCAACMASGAAVRLALRLFWERWRGAFLETMLLTAVGLTSAPSGLLYLCSLLYYGFEDWTFTVLLIWTVGGASGSMVSFAPTLRLLVLHVVLLLVPALGLGLWQGDTRGITFAIGTMVLVVFLLTQGVWLNRAYLKQLEDRAMEEARLRELELAKAAAEAANVAKSLFLANMSHEIRTPMHGVMGMAQVVLAGELPAESRENVEAIHGASETLLHVLNEILDFSKVEAGKVELERAPIGLRRMLEELRLTVRPLATLKGLPLEWTVEDGVPEHVTGDAVRLRQVLMNLLGNAVKFTAAGAVGLRVAREPGGEALRFTVTDSGIGIPVDKQKLIFEAFAQADGSVTRRFGGTGLGLAISAKLVALMGGSLTVRSEVGKGSEFWFAVCLPESAAASVEVPEQAAARERTGLRLLLAEDNAVSQRVAVALLGKRGHHVTVVANGVAAIAAWEREEFDALLIDNQMPEMGGLEAVREIREREAKLNRRRTPAVMLTASAMRGDRERFLDGGVDGYLAKPFRAEELYAAIAEATAPPGCATQ
jgi:signal transduction histidine kinase/CheY-like chemotaxis protein